MPSPPPSPLPPPSPPPPSPPPLNKYGKKIPVPQQDFFDLICECLREDPVKGDCLEVGYTERNSDGDIYGVLSHWDTSEITDMSFAFSRDRLTNTPVHVPFLCSPLLPPEVTEKFNPDLSLWNTSNVLNFVNTFFDQSAFMGTGLKFWTVSRAENFQEMFNGCASFVEAISFWNVENAVNMGSMFFRCAKFKADISLWKTPRNEQMFDMFSECEEFNSNLALWDVSHVLNMRGLFEGASKFNKPIGHWNTSSVTNMRDMFRRAVSFNQDISKWDVRNVVDFSGMFKDAIKFAGDVSKWDLDWPHSSITFANMFSGALAFNNKWVCETSTSGPPDTCELKEPYFFNALGNKVFPNSNTELKTAICDCLSEEPIHGICTEFARESEYGVLLQWDVSRVQDFGRAFDASDLLSFCNGVVTEQSLSLFDADLSHWDMGNATDTRYMFRFLPSFKGKGLKYWDVSSVTRMDRMFDGVVEFNENIGYWETNHVTSMEKMFRNARSFNQDISKWDTSNVKFMFRMFLNATKFKGTGLKTWDVEEVTHMSEMFLNAAHFNDDIGSAWMGPAATSEQNDIFLGADAFNEIYECDTDVDGPVSTCVKHRPISPWRCD